MAVVSLIVLWIPLAQWRWEGEGTILVMSSLLSLEVVLSLFLLKLELRQGRLTRRKAVLTAPR